MIHKDRVCKSNCTGELKEIGFGCFLCENCGQLLIEQGVKK